MAASFSLAGSTVLTIKFQLMCTVLWVGIFPLRQHQVIHSTLSLVDSRHRYGPMAVCCQNKKTGPEMNLRWLWAMAYE